MPSALAAQRECLWLGQIGQKYKGTVVSTAGFGAFINFGWEPGSVAAQQLHPPLVRTIVVRLIVNRQCQLEREKQRRCGARWPGPRLPFEPQ